LDYFLGRWSLLQEATSSTPKVKKGDKGEREREKTKIAFEREKVS
jgi:hypothetical protein